MRRPLPPGVIGHASFARFDGAPVARLRLDRWWDPTLDLAYGRPCDDAYRPLVVIGINPSDAGGDEDDNTSAKCTTFARREGANGLANGLVMDAPGQTSGRHTRQQRPDESRMGDAATELDGSQGSRPGNRGRQAPRGQAVQRGALARAVGNSEGAVQCAPRRASPGHVGVVDLRACPFSLGQHLWVRETFSTDALTVYPCPPVWYRADCGMYDDPASGEHTRHCDALRTGHPRADCYACAMNGRRFRWRPSIFMPRKLSRITLEIAEVRVQRLQEISEDDCEAEGLTDEDTRCEGECGATPCMLLRPAFQRLWDSINGKRAPWSSNPWVWAISFRRLP